MSIGKDAAVEISKGMNTIGSNIGLGATVAGVSTAVAKGVSKSALPPLQKAGVIVAGGVIGGVVHVVSTAINHNTYKSSSLHISKNVTSTANNDPNINHFLDTTSNSPLEILLQCIEILSGISILLIFIFSIQVFYKFYLGDKPELKWVDNVLPPIYSTNFKLFIYKIIRINKVMSKVYMIIILILLGIAMFTSYYVSLELINNIESYINVYTEYYRKLSNGNIDISINKLVDNISSSTSPLEGLLSYIQ